MHKANSEGQIVKRIISPFLRKQDVTLIRDSELFDKEYFVKNNKGLLNRLFPIHSFLMSNSSDIKEPSKAFSASNYYSEYPDVSDAGQNALLHYLKVGQEEGRNIAPSVSVSSNSGSSDIINSEFSSLLDKVDEAIACLDFESAERQLHEEHHVFSNEFLFCFNYAKVLILRGQLNEALKWCEKSVSLEKTPVSLRQLIDVKKKLGIFDDSVDTLYKQLLSVSENKALVYCDYFAFVWERQPVDESLFIEFEEVLRRLKLTGRTQNTKGSITVQRNKGKLLLIYASMLASVGNISKAYKMHKEAQNFKAIDTHFVYLRYMLFNSTGKKGFVNDQEKRYVQQFISHGNRLREYVYQCRDSIYVIGNGPSAIGKKLGSKIDNAKLVIRFNNYSTDFPFCEDVGTKTDVWVRMPFHPYVKRQLAPNVKHVIFSGSNRAVRPSTFWQDMFCMAEEGVEIGFFEPHIFYELQSILKSPPTAGIYICYYLFKLLGPKVLENCIGFSFADNEKINAAYHYSDSFAKSSHRHSWDNEALLFNSLLEHEQTTFTPKEFESSLEKTTGDEYFRNESYDVVISVSPGIEKYGLFGATQYNVSSKAIDNFLNGEFAGEEAERILHKVERQRVCVVGFGRAKTGIYAKKLAEALDAKFYLLEYGLISSMHLPSEKQFNFSLILDDMGIFYDTKTSQSRIEQILLNDDSLGESLNLERAKNAISQIKKHNITKYNNSPDIELDESNKKRILVIDQTANDNSIIYGQCELFSFEDMLKYALEQEDAEVIIKVHPETVAGAKNGNLDVLDKYSELENVTVIDSQCNVISLIKQVDEVYVMTSGVGLEALLIGKKVRCFGVPFYAGWGVTKDMSPIKNQRRNLSIEEIFIAVFIKYTSYFDPITRHKCALEDCLHYVIENKNSSQAISI